MSYILEALKKLEQKRQQEGAPNLLTLQGGTASARKKRTLWPFVISGIVILNIAIILLFLLVGPWKNTAHSPPAQPQVARDMTSSPLTSPLPRKKDEPIVEPKKDILPPAPVLPSKKSVSEPPPSKAAPVQESPLSKTPNEQPATPTKPVQPSKKVLTIKELPADIKNKLSELKMTVHSYNDQPQSRFAVINNTTVREGQSVNNELKLEQITKNGVVLNYQGHRFSLSINENP